MTHPSQPRARRRPRAPGTAVVVAGVVTLLLVAPAGATSTAVAAPAVPAPSRAVPPVDVGPSDPSTVAALDRAVEASATLAMRGRLTVAALGDGGPQVTTVEVARRADGRMRAIRQGAWELGREDDGSYLRSERTGRLLELGGVQAGTFDRTRFLERYRVADRGYAEIDTGSARVVEVIDRSRGVVREILHLDEETGLVVRRETRDADGEPSRVVAYTSLVVDRDVRARPTEHEDDEAEQVALDPVERRSLAERGLPASAELPGGFVLLDASEVRGTDLPTVHLVYGDGLYTLSVYVQEGRLARRATRQAVELRTPHHDEVVWRWPGSEPRRIVWSGDRRTFTAVTDAPTGVLLAAVDGLPNDPATSTLGRLARGFSRVADHLLPSPDD